MRLFSISRAALARHRTLAAALDWSIALLSDTELRLFRWLSVFRGRFDVESALGVSAGGMDPEVAFDAADLAGQQVAGLLRQRRRCRALPPAGHDAQLCRALLAQSDERPALLRRHAVPARMTLHEGRSGGTLRPDRAGLGRSLRAHRLDDVRFALEVCLDAAARREDGRLAGDTASAPLWFHLAQVVEYRDRVSAALALVDRQTTRDTETATWLNTAPVSALLHTGRSTPELGAAADQALAGSTRRQDPSYWNCKPAGPVHARHVSRPSIQRP